MCAWRIRATLSPTFFDILESWAPSSPMAPLVAAASRSNSPATSFSEISFREMTNSSSVRTKASPIAYPGETPMPLRMSINFDRRQPSAFSPEPSVYVRS